MVSTNSIRSSRPFRSTTRSESINDAWERGSSFGATIRQYRKVTTIWPSARRRRSLTQQRSSLRFRSNLKRKFRTAPDWAAEVATPLPCCLRSTRCSKRNYRGKRSPKLQRQFSILLLKPAFAISTAWAYSRWQHSREIPGIRYQAQEFVGQTFANDLERPVFEKFVFLAQLKMWLLSQSEVGASLMSGSGSTVFALVRENADADSVATRAKAKLDPELWTCRCKTL